MNKRIKYSMLLAILIVAGPISRSQAQSRYDSVFNEVAKRYPENLVVFTDRTLYAVNEVIKFSVLLQSKGKPYLGVGSKVLYAELVNSAGNALTKGKFIISENRSSGNLTLPSSVLSGIYYLRCYTRWMRNFESRDFSYIPIRVVNPYSSEVATSEQAIGKGYLTPVPNGARMVAVSPARLSYRAGEMVDVVLSLKEGYIEHVQDACITVIPSGAIDTSIFLHRVDSKPEKPAQVQLKFLPEIEGTTISGVVSEQSNQKPAPDARIHFSILGERPDYFVTESDHEGNFVINTPLRTGYQEMFMVPEYLAGKPIEVRIDNDFTSEALPFQPDSFKLQHDEHVLASRFALHMQLQEAFLTNLEPDTSMITIHIESIPFYGKPEISVKLDEFIDLPNMEEVIENLVPLTYVIRRGGKADFLIKSENPMISLYRPLILVDHIPVFDTEIIMAIPPSKIDHIDVIREVFIKGEVKYGGIISLISRQGDLASIKLQDGSYFFDYAFFQPSFTPHARESGPGKIPDTRNTLFWKEHLELHEDSFNKFSFQAASIPGTYIILLRGVSADGNIVYGLSSFEVE